MIQLWCAGITGFSTLSVASKCGRWSLSSPHDRYSYTSIWEPWYMLEISITVRVEEMPPNNSSKQILWVRGWPINGFVSNNGSLSWSLFRLSVSLLSLDEFCHASVAVSIVSWNKCSLDVQSRGGLVVSTTQAIPYGRGLQEAVLDHNNKTSSSTLCFVNGTWPHRQIIKCSCRLWAQYQPTM